MHGFCFGLYESFHRLLRLESLASLRHWQAQHRWFGIAAANCSTAPMGARSAFVAVARRQAIDGNWRGCARSLLRWRSAVNRGEAARARPCDGRVVGAAVARGCLPRLPDAAATQRIAEYLGEGRAALLDRARGAEAETHALAARCSQVAAARATRGGTRPSAIGKARSNAHLSETG